ncbi:HGGxSTG domain-containing protein [uncultured Roseovarius sp.]|uniref:HGGxSTG domain-containing protein n=1 Tax=uncultured Roseovarius sp. TaxID=293344 RepID=UPI0025F08BC4|nr:HGGxSTG domain-containing protein [uncultured Roseovarius sp.]
MFTKGNQIGKPTRFGPDWPGRRCGAKTRAGTPCKKAAMKGRSRCRNHGGSSTGPRTEAGRARIATAQLKHGRLTKEARAEAKRRAQVGREIRAELRDIEGLALARGWLKPGWRDQFD